MGVKNSLYHALREAAGSGPGGSLPDRQSVQYLPPQPALRLEPARLARRRPLDQQPGEDRFPLGRRPAALLQIDRVDETGAEHVAALPLDLGVDRADAGHVERHTAAA